MVSKRATKKSVGAGEQAMASVVAQLTKVRDMLVEMHDTLESEPTSTSAKAALAMKAVSVGGRLFEAMSEHNGESIVSDPESAEFPPIPDGFFDPLPQQVRALVFAALAEKVMAMVKELVEKE